MSISRRGLAAASLLVTTLTSLALAAPASAAVDVRHGAAGESVRVIPAHRTSRPAASVHAPKGMPPAVGVAARGSIAALTYLYGGVNQFAQADGVRASMTVARPELATADFHTLGEMAAQSADGRQIVEIGWTVDRAVNNGSTNAHLFVFHWFNGNPGCYNGCGFVRNTAATARPGMQLPVGAQQQFSILFFQSNWWVGYNTEWVGHFPGTLWGGGFTRTGLVQIFGEVAANSAAPCTDMGNGRPAADTNAARISNITYTNGPAVNLGVTQTHPNLYTAQRVGTTGGRFGGQGTGACTRRS